MPIRMCLHFQAHDPHVLKGASFMDTQIIAHTYGTLLNFMPDLRDCPPVILCAGLLLSMACCLEGYHLQKLLVCIISFSLGYSLAVEQLPLFFDLRPDYLLPASLAVAICLAALAWKIYLSGIFFAVFQLSRTILPNIFSHELHAPLVSLAASLICARLAVKLNRTIMIAITAVIGGFAMVHFFLRLLPVFPFALHFPPSGSPVYLYARIFLSAAGAAVQLLTPERAGAVVQSC